MNIEEEILKNKAENKMNKLRLKALINLLSKEGIVIHEELEEELNNLTKKDEEPSDN
jgi:hypothetical protein